jgi:two-component system, response regulator
MLHSASPQPAVATNGSFSVGDPCLSLRRGRSEFACIQMQSRSEILIVDAADSDAQVTVETIERVAPQAAVTRLKDGAQALDFLFCRGVFQHREPQMPRLVLLELELPVGHEFEVLAALRGYAHANGPAVIMFTRTSDTRAIERSYALGASGYIVKPAECEKYVVEVEGIVARWLLPPSDPAQLSLNDDTPDLRGT